MRIDIQNKTGGVLILVMALVVAIGLTGAGLMGLGTGSGIEVSYGVNDANAFEMAQAGLERFRAIIRTNSMPLNLVGPGYLGNNVLTNLSSKGRYAVSTEAWPGWNNNTSYQGFKYKVTSVGVSVGGSLRSLTMCATLPRFPSFMHASNYEKLVNGQRIFFLPGDEIDGKIYSNDQINVDGSSNPKPRFLQQVFSAASSVYYQNGANSSVFMGGLSLNAAPISGQFVGQNITDIKTKAESLQGGLYGISLVGTNAGDYNVIFTNISNVGYVRYAKVGSTNFTSRTLSSMNGAIYINGDATVQGVVNGNVTLAAQDTIFITNGITYASATSPNPWQTNFVNSAVDDSLGLLASNAVTVLSKTSINIHAAIMVTSGDGGFGAPNWNTTVATPRPNINLFGSLAQYRRGLVSQGATYGFNKKYKFDARYETFSPPYFPLLVYQFSYWGQ